MARKQRGIVVYHGTLSEKAPHRVFQREGIFHAGTRRAAIDRLADQEALQEGDEGLDVAQPQIDVYEIMPDAPMSMMTYTDPIYETMVPLSEDWQEHIDSQSTQKEKIINNVNKYSTEALRVNAGNINNTIKKYINIVEDPGSMSYQIPVHLVPSKVRHLGAQFYGYNPDTEDPTSDVEIVPNDANWWRYKEKIK